MTDSVIAFLAQRLYSINPSLLKVPPLQEGSDSDECYVDVPCGDLPDGMRPNVASWYLSPERHIQEAFSMILVAGGLLFWLQQRRRRQNTNNQQPSADRRISHPFWVKPVSIGCLLLILIYKMNSSYLNKIYYMIMPCNMLWTLVVLLCFGPRAWQPASLELLVTFIGNAVVALALPDTKDCVLFGEAPFFYINHILLVLVPFAYVWNSSISLQSCTLDTHFHWWLSACCWFGLFYFLVGPVLSAVSGLNLNYMMHPPPNQDGVVGDYYRYMSTGLCAIQFALARLFVLLMEVCFVRPIQRVFGVGSAENGAKKVN